MPENSDAGVLHTPSEWMELIGAGAILYDYDGWRKGGNPKPFNEPISEDEFRSRASVCSMMGALNPKQEETVS